MAEEAPRSAHDASATLKTLRALAAAEQQQCNVARCTLDAASGLLVAASRALRNSLHKAQVTPMLKALLSLDDAALAAQLRLPGALGEASEPSVPPTRLRTFLGAYGSLVTVMRRQPLALIEAVHRSGAGAPVAVPLLLSFVWGHAWRLDDAHALVRATAHAVRLRALEHGASRALAAGTIPERLCCTFLRVLPGGAAWLQAALSEQLDALAQASDHRALVLANDAAALGQHCEEMLRAVLSLAPAAPAALRSLGRRLLLRGGTPSLSAEVAWEVFTEIILALLVAPAIACPEAYGLLLPAPLSRATRANLVRIALALTRSVSADEPPNAMAPAAPESFEAPADASDSDLPGGQMLVPSPLAEFAMASPPPMIGDLPPPVMSQYDERVARAKSANVGAGGKLLVRQDDTPRNARVDDSAQLSEVHEVRALARRCAARIVRGGDARTGADEREQPLLEDEQSEAEAAAKLAEAAEAHAAACGHLQADNVADGEELASLPPPLDCEIPLHMLRALHTICDAQRGTLTSFASDEPMLPRLLDALQPATIVLAEVGIVWGDEAVSLEVGEAALLEFARRDAAALTTERISSEERPTDAGAQSSVDGNVPSGAKAALPRLQHKLAVLLNRLPLSSLSEAGLCDAMLFSGDVHRTDEWRDHMSDEDEDEGYGDALIVPPADPSAPLSRRETWRLLVAALRREELLANASGNDSLAAQLHECLVEIDSLIIAAANMGSRDEGWGGAAVAGAVWVDWIWRGVEVQLTKVRGKMSDARAEWTTMAQHVDVTNAWLEVVTSLTRRLRLARCRAMLPALLEPKDAAAQPAAALDVFQLFDPAAAADSARKAAAAATREQPWWKDLSEDEQTATLCALWRWCRPQIEDASAGWNPSPGAIAILDDADAILGDMSPRRPAKAAALTAFQRAAKVLLSDRDSGMHRLCVPPSQRSWLHACVPVGCELLQRACDTPDGAQSASLLGELWDTVQNGLPSEADASDAGNGEDSRANSAGSNGLADESTLQSGSQRAHSVPSVPGGSWAWILIRCRPPSTSGDLLPCVTSAAAAVQQEEPSRQQSDARSRRRAVWLSLDASSIVIEAAASMPPPATPAPPRPPFASSGSTGGSSATGVVARDTRVDLPPVDEIRPQLAISAHGATRARLDLRFELASANGATTRPQRAPSAALITSTRWEGCWRLGLVRARRDSCLRDEEDRAMLATCLRLRAACVRLHVQHLACWVQADALRALAHGVTVSGVVPAAIGQHTDGGLSVPFEDNAHANAREHHAATAGVLQALRDSPRIVALGLRRAGLFNVKCPAAEVEVAVQFLLCSLYGNHSHPRDERALMALFAAIVAAGASEAGGTSTLAAGGNSAAAAGGSSAASHTVFDDLSSLSNALPVAASAELLLRGGLLSSLVVAYLRMLPGGAAWLQAALGAQLVSIAEASDRGLRLLTDSMDAYVSLSAEAKAEVDRDVEVCAPAAPLASPASSCSAPRLRVDSCSSAAWRSRIPR